MDPKDTSSSLLCSPLWLGAWCSEPSSPPSQSSIPAFLFGFNHRISCIVKRKCKPQGYGIMSTMLKSLPKALLLVTQQKRSNWHRLDCTFLCPLSWIVNLLVLHAGPGLISIAVTLQKKVTLRLNIVWESISNCVWFRPYTSKLKSIHGLQNSYTLFGLIIVLVATGRF